MAEKMTLVSKSQYEHLLKELESFQSTAKSIDKAEKSEMISNEILNAKSKLSESVPKKTDSKKPIMPNMIFQLREQYNLQADQYNQIHFQRRFLLNQKSSANQVNYCKDYQLPPN